MKRRDFLKSAGYASMFAGTPLFYLSAKGCSDEIPAAQEWVNLEQWEEKRNKIGNYMRYAAGLFPEPEKAPLHAKIFGRVTHPDYTVEKAYFESYPGVYCTGNLYRPVNPRPGGHPAILNPSGHTPEKNRRGRLFDAGQEGKWSVPARCITLAKMGCVAWSYDLVGVGDSKLQLPHHTAFSERDYLWGLNVFGLILWNQIRSIDFLYSLPEVDKERIGVTGSSRGGRQTVEIYSVDPRITVAAPNGFGIWQGQEDYGRQADQAQGGQTSGGLSCLWAPGRNIDNEGFDAASIAMMAPKPLLLLSASKDKARGETPETLFPYVEHIYKLYGAGDRVENAHIDAGHNYNRDSREAMYRFFARHLDLPFDGSFEEPPYEVEADEDLLVFSELELPETAVHSYEEYRNIRIAAIKKELEHKYKPLTLAKYQLAQKELAEGLRIAVAAKVPGRNQIGDKMLDTGSMGPLGYHRLNVHDKRRKLDIPMWRFDPEPEVKSERLITLIVHDQGNAALGEHTEMIGKLLGHGHSVYALEAFAVDAEDAGVSLTEDAYFSHTRRSLTSERVYDVVTAMGYCLWHGAADVPDSPLLNIVGIGKAGLWVTVAGAISNGVAGEGLSMRFAIDANALDSSSEQTYMKDYKIHGLLRLGGMPAAASLIVPRPLYFHNTGRNFDVSWIQAADSLAHPSKGRTLIKTERENDASLSDWLLSP